MITEDYVSFEIAKLLKEKGFNEITSKAYPVFENEEYKYDIPCPTHQMIMKWLREEYDLYIEVSLSCDREDKNAKIFDASIFNLQNQRYKKLGNIQGYEKTCETAIKYCLENLI